MLNVNVKQSDPASLHDQVAAQIRRAIADGEAGPGERLPLAKDLAAVLGVNKNTVLRALHTLRDEGLLEFRRGRGITVAGTPSAVPCSPAPGTSSTSHGTTDSAAMRSSKSSKACPNAGTGLKTPPSQPHATPPRAPAPLEVASGNISAVHYRQTANSARA